MIKIRSLFAVLALTTVSVRAAESLRNDRYTLEIAADGDVTINVAGMPPQRLRPEFTVLWTEADPLCVRNPSHPNYPVAPRNAVRWHHPAESLAALNAWVGSPEFRDVTGMAGRVTADGKNRVWEFRDGQGHVTVRVTGRYACDTTRPLDRRAARRDAGRTRLCRRWPRPLGVRPLIGLHARRRTAFARRSGRPGTRLHPDVETRGVFLRGLHGAPETPLAETLPVPQECAARGHKQFDFVMSEADLHLPRVHVATSGGERRAGGRPARVPLPAADHRRLAFRLPAAAGARKPETRAAGAPARRGGIEDAGGGNAPLRVSVRGPRGGLERDLHASRPRHSRLPRPARQLRSRIAQRGARTRDGLPGRPPRGQPRVVGCGAKILRLLHGQDGRFQTVLAAVRPVRGHRHRRRGVLSPACPSGSGVCAVAQDKRLRALRQRRQQAGQRRRPPGWRALPRLCSARQPRCDISTSHDRLAGVGRSPRAAREKTLRRPCPLATHGRSGRPGRRPALGSRLWRRPLR